MRSHMHSHIRYDQLIEDSVDCPSSRQKLSKDYLHGRVGLKTGPARQLQKRLEQKLLASNVENTTAHSRKNYNCGESMSRVSNNDYFQDFDSFQQQIQEIIAKDPSRKETIQSGRARSRKQNQSALLPNVRKVSLLKPSNNLRYSLPQQTQRLASKSTLQLKQQNMKLVRSIESFRRMLPTYRKNMQIISSQRDEISKINHKKSKILDVSYELALDRNVQAKLGCIGTVSHRIKQVEIGLKGKYRLVKKKSLRVGRLSVSTDNPEEQDRLRFQILREDMLFRMREREINQTKLRDLEEKIESYRGVIAELQQKQRLGLHEELKNRKAALTNSQEKECQLMAEIANLNIESSSLEVEIMKINKQLEEIKSNDTLPTEPENSMSLSKQQQISTSNRSSTRRPMRLLNFLKKK